MFLNEGFLKIWEELDNLNEAKADTQKLIDFAGQELTDRFLAIKSKLKSPENDLYYWVKNKTPKELADFLDEREIAKTNTQAKKDIAGQGAKLVCETEYWKVYNITTYEAAQIYGRDTKWCITGINDWGDRYWREYKDKGVDFYFLITKDNYDPRAYNSKFAIAIYPDKKTYEAFDQKDGQVLLEDIKYIHEIEIPGIDLNTLESLGDHCIRCGDFVPEYEGYHEDVCYCDMCFDEIFG